MDELELASTEVLIKEILSRNTFAGLVLYSPEAHKFNGQFHKDFQLRTTASEEDTVRLLNMAAEAIQAQG